MECYVDADFADGWAQTDADNAENIMSYAGYVITYVVCPVLWCSKLLKKIDLSIIEVKYIALSQDMRKVITFMEFMKEASLF